MQKLISIDLKADFGFFRKPDVNSGINLSYNMVHKPALLGIFGAIIGLEGYKEYGKLPEYYEKLKDLKLGVEPLNHERGNFQKTVIKYSNTVGYANKGTNYLTEEATLIKPNYRIYLLVELENTEHHKLYNYLKEGKAEYLPYFGKNEFSAWWERENGNGLVEYEFEQSIPSESFELKTVFQKGDETIQDKKEEASAMFDLFNLDAGLDTYLYFERLPRGFDLELNQYDLKEFAFSTFKLKKETKLRNLYYIKTHDYYVQLL